MEAKLKSLRVADLRDLLQKASVPIPAKANKADLIAKIIASQAAVDAFNAQNSAKLKQSGSEQSGHDDDLLAPPEEFDWGAGSVALVQPDTTVAAKPTPASTDTKSTKPATAGGKPAKPKQASIPTPKAAAADSTPPTVPAAPTTATEDAELEKRKKRAARFGIPLVEAKLKPAAAANGKAAQNTPKTSASAPAPVLSAEDATKIDLRAARFGVVKPATPAASAKNPSTTAAPSPPAGKKRGRSPAPVDAAELERRKKRAERFGSGAAPAPAGEEKT